MGPSPTHFNEVAPLGNIVHPCCGRRDGTVVVEYRQHKCFEEKTRTERAVNSEDGASGHIKVPFAVAPYFAFEPEHC